MVSEHCEPIFVVGTGRSGSTVFFDILAKHPSVAWLSRLANDHPQLASLNGLLMRIRSYTFLDRLLGDHFGPSEAYPFWELNSPGFANPHRDLLADDATPAVTHRLRASVGSITNERRNRFLAKITGWPRIRFLREIFPQALFIEVSRDARPTASSLLRVPFWDGWRGPTNWRRGPLPPDLEAIWREEKESFVALAALECVIVQRAIADCRATLPANTMHQVKYSELCDDPIGVFRKVVDFCHLEWSARFENSVRRFHLVDRDDQWRLTLTTNQQAILERTLERANTSAVT